MNPVHSRRSEHPASSSGFTALRVSCLLAALAALAACACGHAGVQELYSTPRVACPGEEFLLKWRLQGKGVISACPRPTEWADIAVDGSGEQRLSIQAPTTFTLTAPDAAPRDRSKSAEVTVLSAAQNRSALVTCDEQGQVQGSLLIDDVLEGVRVRHLQSPLAVVAGQSEATEVCVTHQGQDHCVQPGQSIELDVPARGKWELRLPKAAADCAKAPGKLGIQFDFDCR